MASLNRAPDLGLFPKEITIRCEKRGENRRRSEHPNVRANILLGRLPKIQSLSIDWHDEIYVFSPAYLEHMEDCSLEQITLLTDQTQLDHIGAFKTAASLSTIVAKDLDPTSTLSSHLLHPNPAGRTSPSLKLMDLGRSHFHYKDFPKLFQIFPAITSLNCAVPFRELFFYSRGNWRATSPPASFIGKAFAPLQECLVNLRLNYGNESLLLGADYSEIDFRDFHCLKVLHEPSTGYFRHSPEHQRNGMRTLFKELIFDQRNKLASGSAK